MTVWSFVDGVKNLKTTKPMDGNRHHPSSASPFDSRQDDGSRSKDDAINGVIERRTDSPIFSLVSVDEYLAHVDELRPADRRRKSSTDRCQNAGRAFRNRVVTYFGDHEASLESSRPEVAASVERFARQLLSAVGVRDARFVGRLRAHPSEYRYLLELSPDSLAYDDVDWVRVAPDATSTSTSTKARAVGGSYFRASFRRRVPRHWRCADCAAGADADDDDDRADCEHRREIDPRRVLREFADAVRGALVELDADWTDADVVCSGSAVIVYVRIEAPIAGRQCQLNRDDLTKARHHDADADADVDVLVVRIQIVLAIPVERRHADMTWPLQGYDDLKLDPEIFGQRPDVRKCHLVIAGDYWAVSFDNWQRRLLKKLLEDPGKKKCLQAIKYLRDQVNTGDLSTDWSSGTLSLILSFIKENRRHDKEEKWRFWSLSERVRNILGNVEQRKAISYIVNNQVAAPESERLSADCRRISEYLNHLDRLFGINGALHFVIMTLLFVSHLSLFCLSATYLTAIDRQKEGSSCAERAATSGLRVVSYGYVHLSLSVLSVALSVVGASWIAVQRTYGGDAYSVLYDLYGGVLYVYGALAVLDGCLLTFGVGLAALTDEFVASDCRRRSTSAVVALTSCTTCLTAVVVLAGLGHLVFYAASVGVGDGVDGLVRYGWELVFADFVYAETLPCLRRDDRQPPRVSVSVNRKESVADDTDTEGEDDVADGSLPATRYRQGPRRDGAGRRQDLSPVSLCSSDGYDCYEGRFNPISPMQSVTRRGSGSACASLQHSPGYPPPYPDPDLASWPSTSQCQGGHLANPAQQQSPLATPSGAIWIPDYPEAILAGPADILDLSEQSSNSGLSTPTPQTDILRSGGSTLGMSKDVFGQILDPGALRSSSGSTTAGNPSSSEPSIPDTYCWSDNADTDSVNIPKQYCRFVDVAI